VTDFYHWVNERLDASPFARHSQFLNFGYRPGDTPGRAAVVLPAHVLNRNCVYLVLELIADTPLAGRDALDIGCGRGGTVSVLNTYFQPRVVAGLDLCGPAVAFCQASQRRAATFFVQADAQALPWRDETFDVVTNVESSHTYSDLARFYGEVSRVLRPRGAFLYTDVLARARWDGCRLALRRAGLDVEDERDVTANVLASCDEVASTHLQAFRMKSGDGEVKNFLAVPGSEAYEEMRSGRSVYGMYRFVKRA
jgi:SAM-dependent methyltransferase